jgi:hypothetical protein
MNQRELERLEKDSIYTMRVSSDLKDQVINGYLSELNKVIKTNVRKRRVVILILEDL